MSELKQYRYKHYVRAPYCDRTKTYTVIDPMKGMSIVKKEEFERDYEPVEPPSRIAKHVLIIHDDSSMYHGEHVCPHCDGLLRLPLDEVAQGWRPIDDNTPKDGTHISICANGVVYTAKWFFNNDGGEWLPIEEDNYYSEWESFKEGEVMLWQPLPKPPAREVVS